MPRLNGERIKRFRIGKGLTLDGMASWVEKHGRNADDSNKLTQVSKDTIENAENGKNVSPKTAHLIATAMNVEPPEELFVTEVERSRVVAAATITKEEARAFQLSWLMIAVLSGSSRHPDGSLLEITGQAKLLGVGLPTGWQQAILSPEDGGSRFMSCMITIGIDLKLKCPRVLPYFQAGFNLVFLAAKGESADFVNAVRAMHPSLLSMTDTTELLASANRIHSHIETILLAE